jgi:predicted acetyltransferase
MRYNAPEKLLGPIQYPLKTGQLINVTLKCASVLQKSVVARLLEFYWYDLSTLFGLDLDESGRYGYSYLDDYWVKPDHFPFLVYVDDVLAGLVLIQKTLPEFSVSSIDRWDIAEFFILRKFRGQHVGRHAAHLAWYGFKGPWQLRVLKENVRATQFWFKTVQAFSKDFEVLEKTLQGSQWHLFLFKS